MYLYVCVCVRECVFVSVSVRVDGIPVVTAPMPCNVPM